MSDRKETGMNNGMNNGTKNRTKDRVLLYLKGVAMGSADAVPGVSGGTIAFISGIYETLVDAIRSFDRDAVKLLAGADFKGFWNHVNGNFLAILLAGIGTAILLLSRVILHWLETYPEMLWSFFFGLIIASALMVGKKVTRWESDVVFAGILGGFLGYWITVATPAQTPETALFVFISGMIAICAMILPGISGSFILVLLSKYEYVLTAVRDFHISTILIFGTGAAVGILSFSHLLHWMLKRFHDITIAMLTGIMVGSLNKIWPWKMAVETYTDGEGMIRPLISENVLPTNYFELVGRPSFLFWAVLLALLGFFLVYSLEKWSAGGEKERV